MTLPILVITLKDGQTWYPNVKPRTAGGQGSGNFGHAGRPGEQGGSAPNSVVTSSSTRDRAETALKNAGLTVIDAQKIPESVRRQLKMSTTPSVVSDSHVIGAQAVVNAVADLHGGSKIDALREGVKQNLSVALVAYEPKEAAMTAVTGQGKTILLVNTNYEPKEHFKDEAAGLGGFESKRIINSGGTPNEAIAAEYHLSVLHELGHFYDSMTEHEASDALVTTLMAKIPGAAREGGDAKLTAWLEKNVSPYAASSPHDAMAETFALMMSGKALPKELKQWGDDVRN